jgi:hypothetical protein
MKLHLVAAADLEQCGVFAAGVRIGQRPPGVGTGIDVGYERRVLGDRDRRRGAAAVRGNGESCQRERIAGQKHVGSAVVVALREVVGLARERHVAAVGRDRV